MAKRRKTSRAVGHKIKRGAKRRAPRKRLARTVKPAAKARGANPSARAIEAALAGIAHDIRTPLTGVLALAELLAASDLAERERQWATAIKSSAEHLAALTTLIVDAARADAVGLTLRHEPFSPRRLAEAVGHALAARAHAKSVKVEVAVAPDLPAMVAGDELRLRAALENLADNAVKFTENGRVAFSVRTEAENRNTVRLAFTLVDSGIGMSKAEIRRLFRPFAQANDQIARRYGGAGLGLVFVRRLATAMGGSLGVASEPGRGTRFDLSVPVQRVDPSPHPEAASAADDVRSLRILCAEDNPYGRVVMNTILTELGHNTDFVESGDAAVKAVAGGAYDAVLLDVTLPIIDGLEAARQIRALPGELGRTPIVGISGRAESSKEAEARKSGMDLYLAKPVSPAKLAEALSQIVSRR